LIAALILSESGAYWPSTMMMPSVPTAIVMLPARSLPACRYSCQDRWSDLDLVPVDGLLRDCGSREQRGRGRYGRGK
jgi:hypothetical protein